MNRRIFIKSTTLAIAGLARIAHAGTTRGKKVLVVIFQRGAVDGLNMIVPHGERAYYSSRPSIAIAKKDCLDLDGFFGAHPSLQSLMPFWKDRSLAIVHAAGSPDATRSHFDAQDFMESGTPGVKSTQDGFLTRALKQQKNPSPVRAMSLTTAMPRILAGSDAIATADITRFGIRESDDVAAQLQAMYAPGTFEAARILKSVEMTRSGDYPRGALGDSLRQIAQLIKSDVGLEVAFADVSGWDTHAAQGGAQGQLANQLKNFSDAIAAFAKDLGKRMSDVVVVTMSEFGRTVRENGNRGTDHGHATVMLTLGGNVRGGKIYGKWPGLTELYEGRDLAVTTDFRDVFGEVLTKHLRVPSLATVFPRYDNAAVKWKGLM